MPDHPHSRQYRSGGFCGGLGTVPQRSLSLWVVRGDMPFASYQILTTQYSREERRTWVIRVFEAQQREHPCFLRRTMETLLRSSVFQARWFAEAYEHQRTNISRVTLCIASHQIYPVLIPELEPGQVKVMSGTKKPSGGRPPRRLFSLDSLKKHRTASDSDTASIASGTSHWRKQSAASSNLLALSEKNEEGNDPFGDTAGDAWTEQGVVQSPVEEVDHPFGDDVATPRPTTPATARPNPRQARANVPPLNLGGSLIPPMNDGDVPPPSPSRRRWDTIRSHVIPSGMSSRSSTPPPMPTRPEGLPDAPSTAVPSRPSTPRGYRFGQKRSMRHVVEQVRDVTHDEGQRLTEEIRKACMMVRFGELPNRAHKAEPVTHNTIGSTLHLPFLVSAGTSAATGGNGGSSHMRQMTGGGLRRPQSVASLGASARAAPTVTHIARALTSSTSVNRPKTLPCETQVLSALLVPFLGPHSNGQVAVEQQTAVETFEYTIRTWKAASSEVRSCCIRAAYIMLTSGTG